jgi:DNA-directed RNA polymerase subunit RPC12/RpoP
MACKFCGRENCTWSFHRFREQQEHEPNIYCYNCGHKFPEFSADRNVNDEIICPRCHSTDVAEN